MIKARVKAENPHANLGNYEKAYRSFSWSKVEKSFDWYRIGQVNIVHEAVDRWVSEPDSASRPALIFERGGEVTRFSYLELKEQSCRWANLLVRYGLRAGDRFFIWLPACPETYFAMLACARIGVIFSTIFSTSSYDELAVRLENGRPSGLITQPDLVERLPSEGIKGLEHIMLTEAELPGLFPQEVSIKGSLQEMEPYFQNRSLSLRSPLYLNYTSGSTGTPKGVVHTHRDMLGILSTARNVLDLGKNTLLWTEADPAWVTGTVYGAFAPWLCGATTLIQGDPFSASNLYRSLERHKVSVWYTTPTTIRRLMEAGEDLPGRYDFSALRHIATVGEPLVPDLFYWVKKNFNLSPHDTWWMTETGIICLANFPSMDTKPGSMGKPVPGIQAAILDEDGGPLPPLSMGELALKVDWPGMMSGLWGDMERYNQYFRLEGWFLTGDIALRDEEGYFYHHGRNDDLLKIEGVKMIGPYEVEHVLYMHPAVAEAAVISKGVDPGTGKSSIKAFIVVDRNYSPSSRLNQEIRAFVKANLSSEVIVKEIAFLDEIPKTRSGKILRRVLRAGELGLPGGETLNLQD